ncbi:MAG: oxygen-independent coproporphyrinogen III oxidase [Hydrogenobacter thermophilus]|uniref:oxygen-independent coproporphyrinogen III oxidase n=1 Tax=Hydrogenobacter thermophilus TaxID=940 RepID=UPI001C766D07|nr:oxygen-independent coproporphyrinogen III oxidase [Hydrogenobacter thermophilus]QWK20566.1 MAG: oxygen-independent coproporphyrinogen III oxidase [Hydrogenobacter thermophilus]
MRTVFDKELIQKYDKPGPRYTSYPPATEFHEGVKEGDYIKKLLESNERKRPLSLYFHIPFCESACWFCGCNVIISHRKDVSRRYLEYIYREMDMLKSYIDPSRSVVQLHWGGGTPNFLTSEEIRELFGKIRENFSFDPSAEVSVEIDPRYLSEGQLETFADVGFNRVSMGLQDLDEDVQKAINRVQPESLMRKVMKELRSLGFKSINIDLIYGLPYQTPEKFKRTIEKTIELDPDRVAVFNFAYVPWIKPLQRKIDASALPPPEDKLKMLEMTIELFQSAGYVFIGMDHFAKPDDELAQAQKEGTLWRNFQGYTTKKGVDLIGIGATSIGMLYDGYFQNYKTIRDYYMALDGNKLPVMRGYLLTYEDLIRREVIMDLMCNFTCSFEKIESMFGINFEMYFERELSELKNMEKDGLLEIKDRRISVLPEGRLLIRNIAMVFDEHIRNKKELRFSRTI